MTIMNNLNTLILAAGKGTRMGPIGKVLPKPAWPHRGHSILYRQVELAVKVRSNKIYINNFHHKTNHLYDQLLNELESRFSQLNVVYESDEIDIGGAIHNVAQILNYKGWLLVLNADQVLNEKSFVENVNSILHNSSLENNASHVLFVVKVQKSEGYNRINFSENRFHGVTSNKEILQDSFLTYSGCSIINLSILENVQGHSKFFESVVKIGDTCQLVEIKKNNFLDIGTLEKYIEYLRSEKKSDSEEVVAGFKLDTQSMNLLFDPNEFLNKIKSKDYV